MNLNAVNVHGICICCHDEGEILPDVGPPGVQWFDARQLPVCYALFLSANWSILSKGRGSRDGSLLLASSIVFILAPQCEKHAR